MNARLLEGFAQQLADVQGAIASTREQLAGEQDREAAACLREKIISLEKFITAIKAAEERVFAAEGEQVQQEEQFVQWRALVRDLREKAKAYDAAAILVPAAQDQANTCRGLTTNAREALGVHRSHPPTALALEKEKASFDAETERLEHLLESVVAETREAVERETHTRARALKLRDELNALNWRENRLRPTSLQPRAGSVHASRLVEPKN